MLWNQVLHLFHLKIRSLLWINSGVATLKKYFDGRVVPENPRITNAQKSIRTNDIENVGKTARHHTFFEMFGNFSIGDYFKEEAIDWAWEFLTDKNGLALNQKNYLLRFIQKMKKHMRFGMKKSVFRKNELSVLKGTSGILGKVQVVLTQKFSMIADQNMEMIQLIQNCIQVEKMNAI